MSDIVLISLIGAVPSTMAALTGVVNVFIGMQHSKQIAKTQETVKTLETNTNSKMTDLIALTKKDAIREGGQQVRDDIALGAHSTEGKG